MPLVLRLSYKTPLYFIFVFALFIDLLNGYFQQILKIEPLFPLLYKGFVIIYLSKYLFVLKSGISMMVRYIICLFIVLLLYWFMVFSRSNYMYDISSFLKIIYAYFVLLYLIYYKKFLSERTIINFVLFYGVFTAVFVILGFFGGFGTGSYSDESFGNKGFFIAGNDIGLTMLIVNCMACFSYLSYKKSCYLLCMLIISVGNILLGTFTGVGGTFVIIISFLIAIYFVTFKDYKASKKIRVFSVIILFLMLIPVVNLFIYIATYDSYMLDKFSSIYELLFENKARETLTDAAISILSKYSFSDWLFGKGSEFFALMADQIGAYRMSFRAVEQDLFDIIGPYGILLGLPLVTFPFYLLIKSVFRFFKTHFIFYYWASVALSIYCGHGLYAGHALTSIQPSTVIFAVGALVLRTMSVEKERVNN